MNAIKSAGNYVSSKTQGASAEAKKETNKSVAKDSNVRSSTRIRAAADAAKAKLDEAGHKREADVHKNKAKHNY